MNLKTIITASVVIIIISSGIGIAIGSNFVSDKHQNEKEETVSNIEVSTGLADSPWPCLGHDRRHTGRSEYDTSHVDGTVKWSFETETPIETTPIIGKDGTIYLCSDNGFLHAIQPDGKIKWNVSIGGYIESTPALGKDGIIYVGSYNNNLYAVNTKSGTIKWNFTTRANIASSPIIGLDGTIYIGSMDGRLYAVDQDGTKKWEFKTKKLIHSSPTLDNKGNIYIGSTDGNIYAIDQNGNEKWRFNTKDWIYKSSVIGDNGRIYVGSWDYYLYALHPNGTKKWSFDLNEAAWSCPAIGKDCTIYISSDNRILHAFNKDGSEKWNFTTKTSIKSISISGDGTVYASGYNNLYALNKDGTLKWKFTKISPHSTSIGSDGTVYVTGQEGIHGALYALGSENEDVTTPYTPKNVAASPSDSEVSLFWDTPADNGGAEITKYKIYRGTDSNNLNELTTTPETTYTDTSVTNGQTYYYQVSAVNSEGEGDKSEVVSVTPDSSSEITLPSKPINIEPNSGDEQVELTWEKPSDNGGAEITEYKIYRRTESENFDILTTTSSTSYADNSVTNGETYYYKVSAVNSAGEGDKSTEVSATPRSEEETVPPSNPKNVNAKGNENEVILTWSAPTDNGGAEITKYKIYRGKSSESLTELTTTSSTSYTDNSVSEGSTYHYKISAVNSAGEGDKSEKVTAKIVQPDDENNDENEDKGLPITYILLGVAISVIAVVILIVLYKKS